MYCAVARLGSMFTIGGFGCKECKMHAHYSVFTSSFPSLFHSYFVSLILYQFKACM